MLQKCGVCAVHAWASETFKIPPGSTTSALPRIMAALTSAGPKNGGRDKHIDSQLPGCENLDHDGQFLSRKLGDRIEGCRVRGQSVKIATSAKVTEQLHSRPHARRLSEMVRTLAFAADLVLGVSQTLLDKF
jgi:hypothetical protein